ncbi:MAG: type II 3-dehydroquinate dehydratase [Flavobacteriales bacterium]
MKALLINGPNLNLVGKRNTAVYGEISLDDYLAQLKETYDFDVFQSNVEGELINKLHEADGKYEGILINAGGYTHTSVAITDAIEAISTPVIEIHISNIFDRETFRNKSLISKNCAGHISGFGLRSYEIGLISVLEK